MKTIQDRIWETRKIRIKTEKRLLQFAILVDVIVPWYSIILIAMAIIATIYKNDTVNLASIIGSVFILVSSILASNQQFRLRADKIKMQYIEFDEIYQKLISQPNVVEIAQLTQQYHNSLKATENHSKIDYMMVVIECRKYEHCSLPKPSKLDWLYYLSYKFIFILFVIALFLTFPIISFFLMK